MNNIHPIFDDLLRPMRPKRIFSVTFNNERFRVVASDWLEALKIVSNSVNDDDIPKNGLAISVRPE